MTPLRDFPGTVSKQDDGSFVLLVVSGMTVAQMTESKSWYADSGGEMGRYRILGLKPGEYPIQPVVREAVPLFADGVMVAVEPGEPAEFGIAYPLAYDRNRPAAGPVVLTVRIEMAEMAGETE